MVEPIMTTAVKTKIDTLSYDWIEIQNQIDTNDEVIAALQTELNTALAIERSLSDQAHQKRKQMIAVFDNRERTRV